MKYLFTLFFLITSCTHSLNTPQKLEPEVFYNRDLKMKLTGYVGDGKNSRVIWSDHDWQEGVAVAPMAEHYKFEVKAAGKHDVLRFKSCNRSDKVESKGKNYDYYYSPLDGLENSSDCIIEVESYHKKLKHGYGLIVLNDENYTLGSTTLCSGKVSVNHGVSLCQSQAGLVQRVVLPREAVVISGEKNGQFCKKPVRINERTFEYIMPRRLCVYTFTDVETLEDHLHYMVGYESDIIRDY